jgi:hypothetical protein
MAMAATSKRYSMYRPMWTDSPTKATIRSAEDTSSTHAVTRSRREEPRANARKQNDIPHMRNPSSSSAMKTPCGLYCERIARPSASPKAERRLHRSQLDEVVGRDHAERGRGQAQADGAEEPTRAQAPLKRTAGDVALDITDDGIGFVTDRGATGLGLRSMEERVRLGRGTIKVEVAAGSRNQPAGADAAVGRGSDDRPTRLDPPSMGWMIISRWRALWHGASDANQPAAGVCAVIAAQ